MGTARLFTAAPPPPWQGDSSCREPRHSRGTLTSVPSLSNQPTTEPGQKRGRSLSVPSVIQFIVQVSALLLGCGYHLARSPARPRSLRTRAESRVLTPVPRIPQAPPPRQPGHGQKQSHNPVPERSRWGEKQSTPPPQDREKAGGASFPRRNFVSEKHDVGDAYSDGRCRQTLGHRGPA